MAARLIEAARLAPEQKAAQRGDRRGAERDELKHRDITVVKGLEPLDQALRSLVCRFRVHRSACTGSRCGLGERQRETASRVSRPCGFGTAFRSKSR